MALSLYSLLDAVSLASRRAGRAVLFGVTFAQLRIGQVSCLECHDVAHDLGDLDGAELWAPPRRSP
jgi:hypothetical protein